MDHHKYQQYQQIYQAGLSGTQPGTPPGTVAEDAILWVPLSVSPDTLVAELLEPMHRSDIRASMSLLNAGYHSLACARHDDEDIYEIRRVNLAPRDPAHYQSAASEEDSRSMANRVRAFIEGTLKLSFELRPWSVVHKRRVDRAALHLAEMQKLMREEYERTSLRNLGQQRPSTGELSNALAHPVSNGLAGSNWLLGGWDKK